MRIVILDPERQATSLLDLFLSETGYDIARVASAGEALQEALSQETDLVLAASEPATTANENLLTFLRRGGYGGPVIFVTAQPPHPS